MALTSQTQMGNQIAKYVRPWTNGMDITRRPSDTWIVDFGVNMSEQDASLYEMPFEYILNVIPSLKKQSEWS